MISGSLKSADGHITNGEEPVSPTDNNTDGSSSPSLQNESDFDCSLEPSSQVPGTSAVTADGDQLVAAPALPLQEHQDDGSHHKQCDDLESAKVATKLFIGQIPKDVSSECNCVYRFSPLQSV